MPRCRSLRGPARRVGARLWAWLRLVRPANSLGATALLLVGAWQPGQGWPPGTGWAALSLWAITAFGYTVNDLLDLPVDRLNKPHRPLVQGLISPRAARWAAGGFAFLALAAAVPVVPWGPLAAGSALLALWAYSRRTKRHPLVGNVQIGLMAAAALVAGAWLRGTWAAMLGPAGVVAAFITGREILKTAEDVIGDRAFGVRTVAVAWGVRAARHLFALAQVLAAGLGLAFWPGGSPGSWAARGLWIAYTLGLAALALGLPESASVRWGLRGSKWGYGLGLLLVALSLR